MEWSTVIYAALALVLTLVCGLLAVVIAFTPHARPPIPSEQCYTSNRSRKPQPLPSIHDAPTCNLTLVVPAYNERERLPNMLKESIQFLQTKGMTYEVLVVDDGSRDGTTEVALQVAKEWPEIDLKVLTLKQNRGKGGAVTRGMLHASGERILMVDADGATRFSDLDLLLKTCDEIEKDGYAVVVGSRAHLVKTEAVVKRSFIRNLLMYGFHSLVYFLGIRSIADTQCGFKLFTRKSAYKIFESMHVERWIFDIEVLLIASMCHMPVKEVSVGWHEVDGSKISLVADSVRMAIDLLVIRVNWMLGWWTLQDSAPITNGKTRRR